MDRNELLGSHGNCHPPSESSDVVLTDETGDNTDEDDQEFYVDEASATNSEMEVDAVSEAIIELNFEDRDQNDAESYYSSGDDEEDHEFYCSPCQRPFVSQEALEQHLTYNLIHSVLAVCEFCGEAFGNDFEYRSHPCPWSRWCEGCQSFHPESRHSPSLPQPTVLVDNSELVLKDVKGGELDMTCLVCLVMMRSRLFLPCSHMACCADCSKTLISSGSGCPICRSIIQKSEMVILS